MAKHSEDLGKHNPNAGPSIAHGFGCTHHPCRCEDFVPLRCRRLASKFSGNRVQSHDEAAAARMTEAKEADRG